jgi:peptide/nickel transport system substrate-binding protein
MNCYDSPNSRGNPVLLDERFRQALNWAVDRVKLAQVAFEGYATPGSTIIPPYSPFHWEPPANEAYKYDPARAKQILDEAGYRDVNGDGFRETKDGKNLTLRLVATTDYPPSQVAGRLITGWFADIGVRVKFSVVDPGVLIDMQYAYVRGKYSPNYDMFLWYWTNDVDPNTEMGVPTPAQIQGWNDSCWTNPEYTKLYYQQLRTLDTAERIRIVQKMQEIFYKSGAYIVYAYPQLLEAYNTAKWEGWVHAPAKVGSVLYNYNNVDTYRFVHLKTAATATSTGSKGSNGVVIAIVVAAIVIAVIIISVVRRRGKAEQE